MKYTTHEKTRMPKKHFALFLFLLTIFTSLSGCATKRQMRTYVDSAVADTHQRIDQVEGQLTSQGEKVEQQETNLGKQGQQLDEISNTAREALERAMIAQKLSEGKLIYETVMSDEQVKFAFDQAQLSPEAQAFLDRLANDLKEQNEGVYIEIQGHTDAIGPENYNLALGQKRAEAAQRYLHQSHNLPLHRLAVISYGEAAPVADNSQREGRSQNRRISLVVLR